MLGWIIGVVGLVVAVVFVGLFLQERRKRITAERAAAEEAEERRIAAEETSTPETAEEGLRREAGEARRGAETLRTAHNP